MGTTPTQKETPAGYIQRIGHSATILHEVTAQVAYGRQGGRLYPILLLSVATVAMVISGVSAPLVGVVGVSMLVLLAVWVGGGGGRRSP
jgi:hypothetical protein